MFGDILIVIACVIAAVTVLVIVSRASPAPARKESNDFMGAVVAVIGTTYAVILAFMLSGVWSMLQQAQSNEEQEANALVNIWRIAAQLPAPNGKIVQTLTQHYAETTIDQDWPALQAGQQYFPKTNEMVNQLWRLAGESQANSGANSIAIYQMMEELRLLTEYRRIRIMQGREELPGILRTVLIAGGIITVASACFFGVPNFRFHVLQVVVLSLLVSLVLVAISDIDRPYQGWVSVEPQGFRAALTTFRTDSGR